MVVVRENQIEHMSWPWRRPYGNLPPLDPRAQPQTGVAMLCVDKHDKSPHPGKQTRGNECISCSNETCQKLKHFHSFKSLALLSTWLNTLINTMVLGRITTSGTMAGGRDCHCDVIHDVFLCVPHIDDVKHETCVYPSWLLANQKGESALSIG